MGYARFKRKSSKLPFPKLKCDVADSVNFPFFPMSENVHHPLTRKETDENISHEA